MTSARKIIPSAWILRLSSRSSLRSSAHCFKSLCALVCVVLGIEAVAQSPPPAKFSTASLTYGSATNAARSLAVGDFDGDSRLDLIVISSYNPPAANILLGSGNGAFADPTQIRLHLRSGGDDICAHQNHVVAVGDFNGDGKLDFAVAISSGTSYLDVYLGDGTGNFSYSKDYTIGSVGKGACYNAVVAADVNGDGKLDLVAYNQGDATVTVLLGNGDGTFQNGVLYSASACSNSLLNLTTGDFNKDGYPDLVLVDSCNGGGIDVLLNNGNGTFKAPVFYQAVAGGSVGGFINSESGIAVGDLNADGKLDAVMTANSGAWVFLGNGDGTFKTAVNYYFPWGSSLAIADVNGDKKLDLVGADYQDSCVWVLLGNGNGTFKPAVAYATDMNAQSVVLADFNGDKKLDLAVGSDYDPWVTVVLGNGDGTFLAGVNYGGTLNNWSVEAAADFNNDRNLDVAVTDGANIQVMLGSSHGTLGAPITAPPCNCGGTIRFVAAGDVNGDGKPDLVAALAVHYSSPAQIAVYLGKGTGAFNAPVFYSLGNNSGPQAITLADVNHDGKLDAAVTNADGSLSILLNKGKGVFGTASVIPGVNGGLIASGDFNGDGNLDLAVSDFNDNSLNILIGNGDGTFQAPVAYPVNTHPEWVTVGDFNKDGKLDLATGGWNVGGFSGGGIAILLGNGNGSFGVPTYYDTYQGVGGNVEPYAAVVADVNLDGNPDLLVPYRHQTHVGPVTGPNYNVGLGIFLGNGDGTFELENALGLPGVAGGPFLVGLGSYGVLTGDFNNDGAPDAAVLNNFGSGTAYVTMLLNTTSPLSISPLSVTFAGTKNVGTSSTQTIILTNDQASKLTITSIAVVGTNATDFTSKHNCGSALGAALHCTITVTFKPLGPLTRTASLRIIDSLGTQNVPLSGVATEVKLSAKSLAFGSVTVGQTKSLPVTLTNFGTAAMNIISPGIVITGTAAADYSQTNNCGSSVGAGQSCTITVTFKPTKKGSRSATLNIYDDGGPSPQKVTLSGTGI